VIGRQRAVMMGQLDERLATMATVEQDRKLVVLSSLLYYSPA